MVNSSVLARPFYNVLGKKRLGYLHFFDKYMFNAVDIQACFHVNAKFFKNVTEAFFFFFFENIKIDVLVQ